ncbi:MAG TPA: ABC transporter substrate-binding protein [Xanthobacteraceae bacterium]|nr:ABC transporter substrate-binding protein [Xanthobacteraceae bacterium]
MKRREFITLLGGSAAAWPLAARAQQPERMRRIGVLFSGFSDTDPEPQARVEAFRRQLQDVGWIEGRNVHIDLRIGAGNAERVRAYAQELVGMRPDVLAANAPPALRALAQETQTIPIVFASVPDPVANGFVDSLARPGGNITGFASLEPAIVGKWLELLKEIAPNVTQVSVIFDHGSPSSGDYERAIADLAPSFHLEYANAAVSDAAAIEQAIVSRARESGGGLVVMGTVAAAHREAIVRLAAKYRVPAVYSFSYFARLGGLVSYGVDGVDLWRRAAPYVDRILRGAKPADLPVQRPTKFELVVNLKTAKALGIDVPPTLLARADEVIE